MNSVGKNTKIDKGAFFSMNVTLGNNSQIGPFCEIRGGVTIGDNVMMAPEVVFYTSNHCHQSTEVPMLQQGYTPIKPIYVEDDVWIGRRVIVLPGVTIGKGSIIGAGAVVAKDIPPYSVAVGNPAVVVKSRII